MNLAVIDLDMLDSELRYSEDVYSSISLNDLDDEDPVYNNLLYIRKVMCSQKKLLTLVLDVISFSLEEISSVNSVSQTYIKYLKNYHSKNTFPEPIRVYRKSTKSWIPALAEFSDCFVLEYGEDVVISDKKDILTYEQYITKFQKK